jgi:8-oxo-dGTP diphosphatase
MMQRRRAAAVIVRDGRVLMVRERGLGAGGRHDGVEYWTLPGGGVQEGESDEAAVRREVTEETGLQPGVVRYLIDVPYPSGMTSVFAVQVGDGEPKLGRGDEGCDCPAMVALDWVPVPDVSPETAGTPIPTFIVAWPTL